MLGRAEGVGFTLTWEIGLAGDRLPTLRRLWLLVVANAHTAPLLEAALEILACPECHQPTDQQPRDVQIVHDVSKAAARLTVQVCRALYRPDPL